MPALRSPAGATGFHSAAAAAEAVAADEAGSTESGTLADAGDEVREAAADPSVRAGLWPRTKLELLNLGEKAMPPRSGATSGCEPGDDDLLPVLPVALPAKLPYCACCCSCRDDGRCCGC